MITTEEIRSIEAELDCILNTTSIAGTEPSTESAERYRVLCLRWIELDTPGFVAYLRREDPDEARVNRFLDQYGVDATFQNLRDFVAP